MNFPFDLICLKISENQLKLIFWKSVKNLKLQAKKNLFCLHGKVKFYLHHFLNIVTNIYALHQHLVKNFKNSLLEMRKDFFWWRLSYSFENYLKHLILAIYRNYWSAKCKMKIKKSRIIKIPPEFLAKVNSRAIPRRDFHRAQKFSLKPMKWCSNLLSTHSQPQLSS